MFNLKTIFGSIIFVISIIICFGLFQFNNSIKMIDDNTVRQLFINMKVDDVENLIMSYSFNDDYLEFSETNNNIIIYYVGKVDDSQYKNGIFHLVSKNNKIIKSELEQYTTLTDKNKEIINQLMIIKKLMFKK